jgi:hypothetical protein
MSVRHFTGLMDEGRFSHEKPFVVFHWNTDEVWGFQSEAEAQERLKKERRKDPNAILAEFYGFTHGFWVQLALKP